MSEIARWEKWDSPMLQDVAGQWVRYDNHRAEVERLTAERDAAQAEVKRLTEQVGALTLALEQADEMKANAEAAVLVEEAETDRVLAERNAAQVEVKRLTEQVGALTLAVEQADELKAHAEAAAAAEETETDRVTAERDAAQAEVERLRGDIQLLAGEIDLWKAAFPCSTPVQMLSWRRFMDARIHEMTSERDGWRSDAERMTAERDVAQAEVERLKANGQAILDSSRPSDEDIWREAFMRQLFDHDIEKLMGAADLALALYRKRWPR